MSHVLARAIIAEMTMVCTNVILTVVNIAVERINRKRSIHKMMGVEMGVMQQSNEVGKGQGKRWGDKGE